MPALGVTEGAVVSAASAIELDPRGVLVGVSGGVDSAVAAMLLRDQGYRVVCVTFAFWSDPGSRDERAGASSAAMDKARRVASQLGCPHLVVDAAGVFFSEVVEYFVAEYAHGRTPNPCVKCNARVRFRLLRETAEHLGLGHVATGHYARLVGDPPRLARGVDRAKDQSYVLAEVPPDLLRNALFPLGEMTKGQVRAVAARAGLESRDEAESQEICFVTDDDHRRFLRARLGDRPGNFVDTTGRVIGAHRGTYNFTVGQRRGLRIAAGEPTYVIALHSDSGEVVVGRREDAGARVVRLTGVVTHGAAAQGPLTVQLRSSGASVPADVAPDGVISLGQPATGVGPGQTAVVYEGEAVVLAGTISSAE